MIEVLEAAPAGPKRIELPDATVWICGHIKGRDRETVAREAVSQTLDSLAPWLDKLDGHYALIVKGNGYAFAAVDPVRAYPLIWARTESGVALTHYGPALEARLELGPEDMDRDMLAAVALSGFTIGNATLYPKVTQIGPGEYLWIDRNGPVQASYYRWEPWRPQTNADPDTLLETLSSVHENLIDDLVSGVDGRPILVPLSAGLDSRMIASGLKEVGYRDVHCVTYGIHGNREAETSQDIARRLGYPWTFIPYSNAQMARMFRDPDYGRYKAYSDSLTGMHFPQEYRMLTQLRDSGKLHDGTVVVNGQSGDFIAGNHIPQQLFEPEGTPVERLDRVIGALIAKHFKHWEVLATSDHLESIARLLRQSIERLGVWPLDTQRDHGIYEYIEFQDRQSKYVLNGQRVYEYLGLDWRTPLWDRACLDFWEVAPLTAKKGETLYKAVLENDNWGGVWKDIPVNPSRIRPHWVRPLRFFAKAMHLPLGRDRWHRFEKRFFDYWMTTTCSYAAWPYWQIAMDRRGHYSSSGWHIASYLNDKGANWDGTVAA